MLIVNMIVTLAKYIIILISTGVLYVLYMHPITQDKNPAQETIVEVSEYNSATTSPTSVEEKPSKIVGIVTLSSNNPSTYVLTTDAGEKFCINNAPSYITEALSQNYAQYNENNMGAMKASLTGKLTGRKCVPDETGTSQEEFYPEYFFLN